MMLLLFLQGCCLLMRKEKSELLMNVINRLLLSSPPRSIMVSVVFDFNDSLNDVAPVSPILLPLNRNNEPSELFSSQSIMWASFNLPTDSAPTTQSPKRKVGTIALWPQARAC